MNIQDVSGNDYEVTIEDVVTPEPEEDIAEIETDVSGDDVPENTVSSGDALSEDVLTGAPDQDIFTETETGTAYNEELLESLSQLNYTATALLFFTVFVWAESKIHSAGRRIYQKWKK